MSNLIPVGHQQTIDSRIVAEMVGKEHKNLLRDIETYTAHMADSNELKIEPVDFFIDSTYLDAKGESRKCYLVTKKGCEMIANKLTGAKGIQFTAAYVTRFNDMERGAAPSSIDGEARLLRARAMLTNAQVRAYKAIMATADDKHLSPIAQQLFGITAIEGITGKHIDYRPEVGKLYSATDIGKELGVHAQTVGRIAKREGMQDQNSEFGIWAMDKSPYGDKQVASFRYNSRGRELLLRLLNEHLEQIKRRGKKQEGLN